MKLGGVAKLLTISTLIRFPLLAQPGQSSGERAVVAYVNNGQKVPGGHLAQAQTIASVIFAEAGVQLYWKVAKPRRTPTSQPADCLCGPIEIAINFVSGVPDGVSPTAFARSFPYRSGELSVEVLVERLTPMLRLRPQLVNSHLAHVLAHEIAHLLQGINRHSETGLMRAHWSEADYRQMRSGRLPFTPADVNLIHAGIESRRAAACRSEVQAAR